MGQLVWFTLDENWQIAYVFDKEPVVDAPESPFETEVLNGESQSGWVGDSTHTEEEKEYERITGDCSQKEAGAKEVVEEAFPLYGIDFEFLE